MSSKLDVQQEWVVQRGWLLRNTQNLLFFYTAHMTRCQYVSVVLSQNFGHFNHTAGQITSFHLVWGVKASDSSSVCIQLLRAWAALAWAELPPCRFSHQIYWSLSCWCCQSIVQQITLASKNDKMGQIPLFLQHLVFSRMQMRRRTIKAEAPTEISSQLGKNWVAEEIKKTIKLCEARRGRDGLWTGKGLFILVDYSVCPQINILIF